MESESKTQESVVPTSQEQVNVLDELANFIFTSKYARYDDAKRRRETWNEAVLRVENMHLRKFSYLDEENLNKIKWAFDLVRDKRIIPSMRAMQFGGKAVEAANARQFNCTVRHIDSIRSFAEIFYVLLCGCGAGLGLSKYFINRLPLLVGANDKTGSVITYTVADTIEGWADSIEALLMCYFKNTAYTGRKIVFDYSAIRRKGSRLKTGGGKAPGYKGLKATHIKIKHLLDYIIEDLGQTKLKPIDAYDILMHSADAVLSGGVRRSATSVVFDKDDEDFLNAKTFITLPNKGKLEKLDNGKYETLIYYKNEKRYIILEEWELKEFENNKVSWIHLEPQRARSNNSVLLLRNSTSKEEFESFIEKTKQFGEPGFVFANHPHTLFNPCFEVGFIPVTEDGQCGVQFCNLTTINGQKIKTKEDFKECAEAYTIIGTLQASYTNFPYLSQVAKQLTEKEALLGCSITAMMANPDILLNTKIQKEIAKYCVEINEKWANLININPSARITCIKPEGSGTKALGSLLHGIHAAHSQKQFLRVQCNKEDNVYRHFLKYNPNHSEESVWSANKTDDVVTFPVKNPEGCMLKSELTAIQHLELIKSTQINWVLSGTTKYNKKDVSHNVSCTVIVKDKEWPEVIDYIYNNKEYFSAVSFISDSGDKDYAQAPNEAITTKSDEEKFEKLYNSFVSVDYTKLFENHDETHLQQEAACAGGACLL